MKSSSSSLSAPFRSAILLAALALLATATNAQPTFTKAFVPNIIGPGSVSTLVFTITNTAGSPVSNLAFTDNLPAGVTIATPANTTSTCGGTLSAPDGGGTISLSGGGVGATSACLITVDVTSSTPGLHTNTSGDLSSSAGTTNGPSAGLTVDTNRPGFTKSFAPNSVPLGARSTLTFTINNSANPSSTSLTFTDNLPVGIEVADPAAASTTCVVGAITAIPGTSVIAFNGGFVAGSSTCTVTVDVVATGVGLLGNTTEELIISGGSSGKAAAILEVTVTPIALVKSFTDDPVPPGGTVTLAFTITNFDRFNSATGIAFADNLGAALAGLTSSSLLANDCGGSVAGVGTTVLNFTGGSLAPEASCTLRLSLSVPAGAVPGTYANTTGAITATIGGSPVTGNMASEDLFVEPVPVLTKEFLDASTLTPDPVINAGDNVVMRFTITNTSTTSGATAIAFIDELTTFVPFPVSVVLPATPCGAGSSIALISLGTDRQGLLLTGGNLTAAPGAGATCTFDVTLTVPVGVGPGIKVNTTEAITATVDGATRTGLPASDEFTVIAAPSLSKAFTDDPVLPGGTVTLEFTIDYPPDAAVDATAIAFTDDLASVLTGLTANLPPTPDPPCGAGSSLTGSPLLTFAGGTLTPGASCAFSVTLNVPAAAAYGSYPNTTSDVTATVAGATVRSGPASDALRVSGMNFTKEFLGDPAIAGETVTLRFTIENLSPTDAATITLFIDNLDAALAGLAATGPPTSDTCGGTLGGTTSLTYIGGSVSAGSTCTIEVPVLVPATAADDTYINATSNLFATLGAAAVTIDPAIDDLIVNSTLLQLNKEFTDDPVAPSDTVNLRFTLTNLDAGQAASGVAFSDDLGAVLTGLVATGLPFAACGGTVDGIPDAGTIDFSSGSLGPGASCFFDVSVAVPVGTVLGIYTNTTSGVTGTIGGFPVSGDAASDDLVVVFPLGFSKFFAPATIAGGEVSTLTFTLDNSLGVLVASAVDFIDFLPAGVVVANPANASTTCGGGTLTAVAGAGSIAYTGGAVAAGSSCVVRADVTSSGTGVYVNISGNLTSSSGNSGPAVATLTVADPPPAFSKGFAPNTILTDEVSTLTFTIGNTAASGAASALAFTDNLPAGVVVANPANASTTCSGGTLTAVAGAGTISYTGGSVAAGASCIVRADVTSSVAGGHLNTSGNLTSSLGTSGPATATLTVTTAGAPLFSKSFAAGVIELGGVTMLTFTIDNTASPVAATGLDFTDNLPTGMEIANPANASTTCTGGTLTAVAGTAVISYSGGTVAAAASCIVEVNVTVTAEGTYVNTTENLTSSLGVSGSATAPLQVRQNVILIPTLSTWALIVFALLVAGVAARQLRLL